MGAWCRFYDCNGNAEYTYELDLTDITTDVEFKIRPNGGWVGIGNATLVAADGLVTGTDNFILKNSTSGYKTYTITATWTGGKSAVENWTVKVEGKDLREEPIPVTYTVAGTPDAIFGTVWDQTNTANDMTENSGIYTFTKTGVELTAGDEIMFKVVLNHSWETSYGNAEGGDVYYKVNVTGTHDVTITFDPTVGIPEITLTDDEPVDGQELVNGDYKVVIKGVHYLNLTENNYVLTITSDDTMTGLGGSFWNINGTGYDADNNPQCKMQDYTTVSADGKTLTVTATSNQDPQLYTPLYVLIKDVGEVNFGQPTIDWEEVGEVPAETYTVTFVNEAGWEGTIYAYSYTNDGETKELGDWPGTAMTPVDGATVPTYTIELPSAPEYIIFNNNGTNETASLAFENGKQYTNAAPTTENTVTFVNSRDWDAVYAYTYDGDGEVLGGWPGTAMTPTGTQVDGHDVYTVSMTGTPAYIIFNNGTDQSPDYVFENGKQYDYPEAGPTQSYTVKFVDVAGWGGVNMHAWNSSVGTSWPGVAGEKTGTVSVFGVDADVYTCTVDLESAPTSVIFNYNGTQSQDGLAFVEGATYSYDSDNGAYFLFTDDDADQFKPAENISVTAKASYARQFTPGNVCTVVLPFAIGTDVAKAAGKFYRISSIADGYIRGTEETPAPYVPYIFIPATEYPFTNIGIGQLPAVQNNSITTAEGYTLQFVTETTELASDASYDYYGFSNGKFVKAAYATVNPFRSYIKVAKSANAPATLIWTDDEATGISSLKADIQNGKANVYDLQGRRVLNPVRGLYIVNGKKVIVK